MVCFICVHPKDMMQDIFLLVLTVYEPSHISEVFAKHATWTQLGILADWPMELLRKASQKREIFSRALPTLLGGDALQKRSAFWDTGF